MIRGIGTDIIEIDRISRAIKKDFFLKKAFTYSEIEMAKSRNQSLAQMALAWVLKDDIVTSVLTGASKAEQVLDNIAAIRNIEFCDEELEKIDKVVKDNE